MKLDLRLRLASFVTAIGVVLILMAWAVESSWRHATSLGERLEEVDLESYRLADHFEQRVLQLNNVMLRYAQAPQASLWQEFEQVSGELDRWLDEQESRMRSPQELEARAQLDQTYDLYLAAARELGRPGGQATNETSRLVVLGRFERQGQRAIAKARELGEAHRQSWNSVIADSRDSLRFLRNLLFGALLTLGLCCAGFAVLLYRGLVRPLQSRLVEAQAVAARSEKLAALGVLAAGVAHEVRNPLTAIKARIFILQKRLAATTQERAAIDIIDGEVNRLERIVHDFLDFARPSEPRFETLPAANVLRDVHALLAPQFEAAGVNFHLGPLADTAVMADGQQLKQLLINLAQNACDACPPGGRVALAARTDSARLGSRLAPVVAFEVTDNGSGIPVEVQRRLFDPFFTTKAAGTGLGLAIAARIVEKHGGRIQYQTAAGRGTTFAVLLPQG